MTDSPTMPDIDWSKFVARPVANTCTCAECGHRWRSHAKYQQGSIWAMDACPECGCHLLRGVQGDPEHAILR